MKNRKFLNIFLLAILVLVAYGYWQNAGKKEYLKSHMKTIYNKVAEDAETQYYITVRQGDKMQICVQAGIVSAAYLQAQDETNYDKWKAIEKKDREAAGMP